MAPEVLKGDYTEKADCWSMGVIIYMLLSSQIPFYSKRSKNMIAQIMKAKYKFDGPGWDDVSNGAKHLVANLLVVDPEKRYTAQQSLDHLWIRKWIEHAETAPPDNDMLQAVDDSLLQYRHTSTLKKLALNVSLVRLFYGRYRFRLCHYLLCAQLCLPSSCLPYTITDHRAQVDHSRDYCTAKSL